MVLQLMQTVAGLQGQAVGLSKLPVTRPYLVIVAQVQHHLMSAEGLKVMEDDLWGKGLEDGLINVHSTCSLQPGRLVEHTALT